jgi:hypothetical protein
MGQRLALLEQLAAAKERAEEAEASIEAQLNAFVSGMVVGSVMARAEDVIRIAKLALQSHRADIKRILDDLDRVQLDVKDPNF